MGEHLPCKQGVRSSNLLVSTICILNKNYCKCGSKTILQALSSKFEADDEERGSVYEIHDRMTKKSNKEVTEKRSKEVIKEYGYNRERDTPVSIPNTEVKPFIADDTWGADPRESKS